jgi:hypothetical protein
MAPRWEYHVEVLGSFWDAPSPEAVQQFLTESAEEGWELVELGPIQTRNKMMLILRRPVQTSRRKKDRGWP